jgi:hypothetical protein
MESDAFFQEKIYLTPNDLRAKVSSIDAVLTEKLRGRLERRCTAHGFVLPESVELLTRSAGSVDSGKFTGDWAFLCKAKGRVLHPPEGATVEVEIQKFNKMGIYGVYRDAIRIMIPRDLHIGDDDFDSLKVGETIRVEIMKSRYQLRDPFIVSVGVYRGRSGDLAAAAPPRTEAAPARRTAARTAAAAPSPEEEEEEVPDYSDLPPLERVPTAEREAEAAAEEAARQRAAAALPLELESVD